MFVVKIVNMSSVSSSVTDFQVKKVTEWSLIIDASVWGLPPSDESQEMQQPCPALPIYCTPFSTPTALGSYGLKTACAYLRFTPE